MYGRATIRLGIGPHSSVNLECRSETCCARLAGNTGRKKVAKNRHLGTIAQLCWVISSQLRHVSTIGKNLLSSDMSTTCPHNMVNFGLLTAEIHPAVWGTYANFNGFCVLAALLHGIYTVSQKKGATLTMAITLSILDRFAKFFHCCKEQ